MGGIRASTAAAVGVSRLECLKLELQLVHEALRSSSSSPSSSSAVLQEPPAGSPVRFGSARLHSAGSDPAVRAPARMDPAVLIFLLYVMIAHELVCGWMQYRSQSAKPRKRAAGPLLRTSARVCQGAWRASSQSVRTSRGGRDLRKYGRIVRKA